MDPAGGRRPSALHSLIERDRYEPYRRNDVERSQPPSHPQPKPVMATSIMTASSSYTPHPHPSPFSHSTLPSPHALPNLMSPTHPLPRLSDERPAQTSNAAPPRPPQKLSLPSIHEALGDSKPPYGPPSLPLAQAQSPHQPSPTTYGPPAVPRSFPPEPASYAAPAHAQPPSQRSPPQPIHPQAPSALPRPDPITPTFNDGMRHSSVSSMSSRHGPPAQGAPYPPQSYEQARHEEPRPAERMSLTNGYTHQPPQQHPPYDYAAAAQNKPQGPYGQPYNQYPSEHQPRPVEGADNARRWPTVKRHLDSFDLEISLSDINVSSKALMDFSAHYHRMTQELQRQAPTADRMPNLGEVQAMITQVDKVYTALHHIKEKLLEQQQIKDDQYARMQNGKSGQEEYADEQMYGSEDMKTQAFGVSDGKKRRGRAAPPGRCHSCNRAETPEWRRGPDGARTLCNACGLHYAKLTRKLGTKQNQAQAQAHAGSTSLRPKSAEDSLPRV